MPTIAYLIFFIWQTIPCLLVPQDDYCSDLDVVAVEVSLQQVTVVNNYH